MAVQLPGATRAGLTEQSESDRQPARAAAGRRPFMLALSPSRRVIPLVSDCRHPEPILRQIR
jgi:hypothetical protein